MAILLGILTPLQIFLDIALRIGRWIAVAAIAIMVLAILVQVFFRYVLGNALPWPEELAIFLMLWMTGLIAPTAYRRGGFVALDIVTAALPTKAATVLSLILLVISGSVLFLFAQMGWGELNSLAGRFKSASLYYPTFSGWEKMPNSWQIMSFVLGLALLFIVNIELILRALVTIMGGQNRLRSTLDTELQAE